METCSLPSSAPGIMSTLIPGRSFVRFRHSSRPSIRGTSTSDNTRFNGAGIIAGRSQSVCAVASSQDGEPIRIEQFSNEQLNSHIVVNKQNYHRVIT